jgi:hypothetical protein
MDYLTDDIVGMFKKRALDIAGNTSGLSVHLDEKKIELNERHPFKSYCELYLKDNPNSKLYFTKPDNTESKGRWEIGFALSEIGGYSN